MDWILNAGNSQGGWNHLVGILELDSTLGAYSLEYLQWGQILLTWKGVWSLAITKSPGALGGNGPGCVPWLELRCPVVSLE